MCPSSICIERIINYLTFSKVLNYLFPALLRTSISLLGSQVSLYIIDRIDWRFFTNNNKTNITNNELMIRLWNFDDINIRIEAKRQFLWLVHLRLTAGEDQ